MLTFILAAALAVSGPVLRPDNIPEIVSLLTLEEKAAILVGCGSSAFDGIGRNAAQARRTPSPAWAYHQ